MNFVVLAEVTSAGLGRGEPRADAEPAGIPSEQVSPPTEAADLLDGWVRLDHRDDWDTVRGQLVAALKPQTGLTKAEALVDALGTTTARAVRARLVRPVDDLAAFLAESAEQWRAVLVGADLAEAVADLNRRRPRALP